jgi:hypothetical protein
MACHEEEKPGFMDMAVGVILEQCADLPFAKFTKMLQMIAGMTEDGAAFAVALFDEYKTTVDVMIGIAVEERATGVRLNYEGKFRRMAEITNIEGEDFEHGLAQAQMMDLMGEMGTFLNGPDDMP